MDFFLLILLVSLYIVFRRFYILQEVKIIQFHSFFFNYNGKDQCMDFK